MGVKHGNLADAQVEKSGSPPAILGVRMPGLPPNLYTGSGSVKVGSIRESNIKNRHFFTSFRKDSRNVSN